jgi:solute carrier family 38 (sodium-coupled neutral amino acid transporter), member 11
MDLYLNLQWTDLQLLHIFQHCILLLTSVSFLLCLALALGGFLAFTDLTHANILNNFSENDTVINICRLLFGMNMFLTFPLECFVCREVIFQYLWGHMYHPEIDINHLTSPIIHIGTTLILVFSAMLISLASCDLGFMLELTGGFAATMLAFILPAACYLKLSRGTIWSRKKLPSILLIGFGIGIMVLSTTLSITNFLRQGGKECE